MAVGREEVEMVKPRSDNREYRRIVLVDSLSSVLLLWMSGVGSFCDPEGLDGLALFLEHMLFYASEKYPVSPSTGVVEMPLQHPNTHNYFFDVNIDSFEEALDRFAQFFIRPLMSTDATMREIKAVHSENQKNSLLDNWRMNQAGVKKTGKRY